MLRPTLPHLFHWRLFRAALLALAVAASFVWTPALALAGGKSAEETAKGRASYRYVHMTAEEALAELDRRGVPYVKVDRRVGGVVTPVRLTGKLHGVHIHSSLPEEKRATSAFEIMDARFALALDDFAALLARHDIVELVHFTMYRPNGQKPGTKHKHPPTAKNKKKKGKKPSKRAKKAKKRKKPKASKGRKKAPKLGKGKKRGKRHASAGRKKSDRKQKTTGKKSKKSKARKGRKTSTKKRAAKKTATKKKGARKSSKTAKRRKKPTRKKSKTAKKKGAKAAKKGSKKPAPEEKPVAYSPPGTRHPAGLAIDVGGFRKADGRWLGIAQHFRGKIGKKTCGRGATPGKTPESRELWSIACESVELGMFTYVLTPNYDKAHFDHFHMEIRPKVAWHWVK